MKKSIGVFLGVLALACGVGATAQAANPVLTTPPEVVVVEPMCQATEWWGQNKYNTHDGYLGERICGCDPTAWGQILTYYASKGYAKNDDGTAWTFTPISNWVQEVTTVDGKADQHNLEKRTTGTLVTSDNIYGQNNTTGTRVSTTTGETLTVEPWNSYTWITSTSGDADGNGTVDGKDHAGKLLWDLNVIGGAIYSSGTLTTLYDKNSVNYGTAQQNETTLSRFFTFLKGKGWRYTTAGSGVTDAEWKGMVEALLRGSLQAGAPIQAGVTGHAIICDGFGYQDGVPYFHLNYGSCGDYNCWVPIEWFWNEVTTSYSAAFYQMVVNVQPEDVGCVIAGVVMNEGVPQAGVTVTCGELSTTTDEKGAYIFKNLTEKATYEVSCNGETQTVTLGTFVDEAAREALQGLASNDKENGEKRITYDIGHAVVDFGEKATDYTRLATIYDFSASPADSYSLNLNGNGVEADGSVTIKSAPVILTYSGDAWLNTEGISVVMKYHALETTTSDRALIATSRDTSNTSSYIGISVEADDGKGKGVDGTSNYYHNTTTDVQGEVPAEGYAIFVYKYDGDGVSTFGYNKDGGVIYTSSKLKYSSGAIGKTVSLGGVESSLIARGMVIEGVQVYKGVSLKMMLQR